MIWQSVYSTGLQLSPREANEPKRCVSRPSKKCCPAATGSLPRSLCCEISTNGRIRLRFRAGSSGQTSPSRDERPGKTFDSSRFDWNVSRGGNFWRGAIIGHGNVPLLPCIRTLKRAGYAGVLSIEFEGIEDPLMGTELGQANLRRLVEMA